MGSIGRPSDEELYDAYVYLLGRALVVRQEIADLGEDGVEYNVIKYNPVGAANFVNPNLDVAYLEAWIAVDEDTPAVLTVPPVHDRYYTAQILDEWGEVICNINERTFPETPSGDFVLHAPGSVPPNTTGVPVELHSDKAKLLARVEIAGDLDGAVALQQAFSLVSAGMPQIGDPPPIPAFENAELIGSEIFDLSAPLLASAPDPCRALAPVQDLVARVAAYVASDANARAEVDARIASDVVPRCHRESMTSVVTFRDGWLIANTGGVYGDRFKVRTAANLEGIWANSATEVVYYVGSRDAQGQPYQAGEAYALTFAADALPADQVNAYWSITLVDATDFRVVPNTIDRYNLNTYSSLQAEPDGSLRIDIAPSLVTGRPQSNWLPSPPDRGFSLTLRLYVPKQSPLDGTWAPPALVPAG